MYLRAVHADKRVAVLQQLIRENPLGILTTAIPHKDFSLIQTTHIPWVLDVHEADNESKPGVLRGHLARQNPQSKVMIEAMKQSQSQSKSFLEQEVVVLFNSPVHHYVTPKFYTETKPDTGKVVPTWNYAAAAAYGRAKIFYEPDSEEFKSFLSQQIDDLTQYAEETIMGFTGEEKPSAWKVTDAPSNYINIIQKAIIGIEIQIDRLEGKFKMSQEMGQGDRDGVVNGFKRLGTDIASRVSDLVQERSDLKNATAHTKKRAAAS